MNQMMGHRAVLKSKNSGKVKLWKLKDNKNQKDNENIMKDAKEELESREDWSKKYHEFSQKVVKCRKAVMIEKQHGGGMKKMIKEKRLVCIKFGRRKRLTFKRTILGCKKES